LPDIFSTLKSDVIEHLDADGYSYMIERFERSVPVGELVHRRENKIACEACPRYARGNLACPPYSPYFPDYIGEANRAIVICYRVHMEHVREKSGEPKNRTAHMLIRKLLLEELYRYRELGYTVAGAGPCLFCKECVAEYGGKKCRAPSRLIYSLESLGINLISLSENVLGLKLEWGGGEMEAENVAAIGAVFHS